MLKKDLESRIEEIEEIVEDNNRMLRKIRKKEVFNFWFNIIKILILLGVFYYGYLFVEPFIDQLTEIYKSIKETADSASEIRNKLNVGLPEFNFKEVFGTSSGAE